MPGCPAMLAVPLVVPLLFATALSGQEPQPPGLRAGVWTYSAVVNAAGHSGRDGERTIRVAPTRDASGAAAWLVAATSTIGDVVFTDTAVFRQAGLAPVTRHAAWGDKVLYLTADTSLHGFLRRGPKLIPVNWPFARCLGHIYLSYYALRAAFADMPLRLGWTDTASVMELDPPIPSTYVLRVTGVDRIKVPAGEFDCWHVVARVDRYTEDYWVDRETGDVVRVHEAMRHGSQTLRLELLRREPAPDRAPEQAPRAEGAGA